ncbi:MAG: methyl-accepting chemotaxis protein [Spirochaetaceae bacterium]
MSNGNKTISLNSIGGKIVIISSIIVFFSLLLLSAISIPQMSNAIVTEAMSKLVAMQNSKVTALHDLLNRTVNDSSVIADTVDIKMAVDNLITYHKEMGISATGDYIITGESDDLTLKYSELYASINKNVQKYNDIYNYYDVLIVCVKHGHVMYSNAREADLGSNLSVGQYKDSSLGKLWKKAVTDKKTSIVDLESYEPSNGDPAMFIGSPVYDGEVMTALVVLQPNNNLINKIMTNSAGMGETGESYCVGVDNLMRTESRFSKQGESTILKRFIDTPASRVLDIEVKDTITNQIENSSGVEVLSAYSHGRIDELFNADFDWAVIAEINKSEIIKPVNNLIRVIILIAVIIIIIAVFILIFVSKTITTPIILAVEVAEKISSGNLDVNIESKYLNRKDETGALSVSLQTMIKQLTEVVGSVITGSEQMATASNQLSNGNHDLTVRTEAQASSLQETSAAIEQMNSSIRSNADNTTTADQLSRDALVKTEDGSRTVHSMIDSMNEISTSSNTISEIIDVINNIAFQTNLLALNASIEAARAGEQGKGFAVVAVEVRKLAKRSDKAATEISEIIKNSNKKVSEGLDMANGAGDMLNEINGAVKKVAVLITEISASSQEQLTSVDQIDNTLSTLDENTQKNASLVEEAGAATEELSTQAEELLNKMKFFKLSEEKHLLT